MPQLYPNLNKVGVEIIYLIETNIHWKKPNVFTNSERTVKHQWPKNKLVICVSESNTDWNTEYIQRRNINGITQQNILFNNT